MGENKRSRQGDVAELVERLISQPRALDPISSLVKSGLLLSPALRR